MIDERIALTVDEVAAQLGISRTLVYRMMQRQGLPFSQLGGKRLINRDRLVEWLDSQEVAS